MHTSAAHHGSSGLPFSPNGFSGRGDYGHHYGLSKVGQGSANQASANVVQAKSAPAQVPSVIFTRSESYTQLQQGLSVESTQTLYSATSVSGASGYSSASSYTSLSSYTSNYSTGLPAAGASASKNTSVEGSAPVETLSPTAKAASDNILSFIEAQLERDVADGATEEELTSRIEAGLEGFKKGFEDAYNQLQEAGLLSEAIEADIQQTYDRVLEGVDELRAQYTPSSVSESKGSEETDSSSQLDTSSIAQTVSLQPANASPSARASGASYERIDDAESRKFNFSLTTADGDQVTIDISSMRASVLQKYAEQSTGISTLLDYANSQSESQDFTFSVDGELDADELKAINDLLSQVTDLADQFYSGDVEAAFQAAQELGYDSSEISTFALNLSHTQVQRVTQVYDGVAGASAGSSTGSGESKSGVASLSQRLQPLGGFVQSVLNALESANHFRHGPELLTDLAQKFDDYFQQKTELQQQTESQNSSSFSVRVADIVDGLQTSEA